MGVSCFLGTPTEIREAVVLQQLMEIYVYQAPSGARDTMVTKMVLVSALMEVGHIVPAKQSKLST